MEYIALRYVQMENGNVFSLTIISHVQKMKISLCFLKVIAMKYGIQWWKKHGYFLILHKKAKINKSYDNIESGTTGEILTCLTGGPIQV